MEQHFAEILELSIDIHYYFNVSESKFAYINPAIREYFGIDPDEIIGKDYTFLLDIIHPEDRETYEGHWNIIINSNHFNSKSATSDYRFRTHSDKFIWFSDTHRYVRNNEGKIISVIGCLRDITDLKVVEILKSTTKERLNLAMEAASDSIWEWKVTSNRLFFDARFYSILEYEAYEFPDNFQEWEKRMHPDDRKNAFSLLKECATGRTEQIHIEYRILSKKSHWKWILCRAKVSGKNDDGKIIKIIGTQTDITKLKEAEEEIRKHNIALQEAEKTIQRNTTALQILYNNLKENEERLQLFFDEAKNTAFIMLELNDDKLRITEFSSGGENIFGISRKDIIQKNFIDVCESSENKHFCELIQNLNNTNEEFKGEIPIYRKTGEFNTCLLTVHFIMNGKTGNKKILTILTDIQERKEFENALRLKNKELIAAEEKLKAINGEIMFINGEIQQRNIDLRKINEKLIDSEEKFRELAENTHDAFWLRDEKQMLYVNPSFEKLWGRNKNEIFENPHNIAKWIHPEDRNRYAKWDDFLSLTSSKSYSEQFRIIKSDGTVRWLWSRIHPVFNSEGKIYRLAGIATDITELKETEKALLQAKEKAMESDNLKSAFLANISHEIRTPMNGILGFIELLNDDTLTHEIREQYINIIKKSSKQLLQIINDIIDISKIEANQVHIDIKECNINSIIKDIYLFYQKDRLVVEKGHLKLKIDLPLEDDKSKLYIDESRFRQILMNLLDNAVKFTSRGEIVVGYRVLDKTIKFFIKDTGIGIPQDQHHLVFERFRQIDDSATRKYGGTGLGLSISQGLAKLLGGEITFNSEVGKGTTFYITLPYNPVCRHIMEPEEDIDDYCPNMENKTILIVEDDDINFELLKTILEISQARIIQATSGEDALKVFSEYNDINLVLMDIRLPGMNGYQAMRLIKDSNPNIPIIAQTAFAMAEDNRKCLEQGFDGYISKPINRQFLYEELRKYFNGSVI